MKQCKSIKQGFIYRLYISYTDKTGLSNARINLSVLNLAV